MPVRTLHGRPRDVHDVRHDKDADGEGPPSHDEAVHPNVVGRRREDEQGQGFPPLPGPRDEDERHERPRAPRDEGAERDEDDAGRVGRVPPFKPADRVREVRREDDSGAGRETKSGGEGAGREGRETRQEDGRRHGGPWVGRPGRAAGFCGV